MGLFKASCPLYSFYENSGGKLSEHEALVFQFLLHKWLILLVLHLQRFGSLRYENSHYDTLIVLFPNPQFRVEMDSPSATYAEFTKVTVLGTVQHNKLVRTATCHYLTFWVWKVYYKNYSAWNTWNISINFIWTFPARDIKNLPRSPVYDYILEEVGTLICRNHKS